MLFFRTGDGVHLHPASGVVIRAFPEPYGMGRRPAKSGTSLRSASFASRVIVLCKFLKTIPIHGITTRSIPPSMFLYLPSLPLVHKKFSTLFKNDLDFITVFH
jgi:hypothetical protein